MALTINGIDVVASVEPLGDLTVSYQAGAALAAGNRQVAVSLPGVQAGDVLSARPIGAVPAGYDIGAAFSTTDDTIVVIINHPALTLMQTFSVQVRIFRIMTTRP